MSKKSSEESVEIQTNCSDYTNLTYIGEGGMGKVYSAKRVSDGTPVALKFFGYTNSTPCMSAILQEIRLLTSAVGIEGMVQMFGVFKDTSEGLIPGKQCDQELPVIVMEHLTGGALIDVVLNKTLSERELATIFKSFVLALDSLHKRGFIHRDLKLENLMLARDSTDSPVKIIDFGLMVRVPAEYTDGVYRDTCVVGTPGYIAPESIQHYDYSPSSDLWQVGCIVYSMLSGLPAFHPQDSFQRTYFDMSGVGWDGVSDSAKDLVEKLLQKNPRYRLSIQGILDHPWVRGEEMSASTVTRDVRKTSSNRTLRRLDCMLPVYALRVASLSPKSFSPDPRRVRRSMSTDKFEN